MSKLRELADLAGISSSYIDKIGGVHYTSDDVRAFFLEAMGFETGGAIENSLAELKKKRLLPCVMSFYDDEVVSFKIAGDGYYHVYITDENHEAIKELDVFGSEEIRLDNLNPGYYNVFVENSEAEIESLLIYAPKFCYQPDFIKKRERIFGVSVMLYALHSQNSMGIGDFSDLAEIVKLTAQNGGDVVGINPIGVMSPFLLDDCGRHAKKDVDKCDVSPYRTVSRLFVNYIYLNLRDEIDFKNSDEVASFMKKNETEAVLNKINASDKVLYKDVLNLKLSLLTMMFKEFRKNASPKRRRDFSDYMEQKGQMLQNLCLFEVLAENQTSSCFWRYWDNNYDNIKSAEVEQFRKKHAERLTFYAYCHWLADLQIKAVQKLAKTLNMKIGVYSDMPIGAASNGAEVWENPQAYVLDAGIGAPADPMRPRGQSWGFTPYHPNELKKQQYEPFIRLVRENMQYSGALRIDHAMGLQRLFWGFFKQDNPVVQGAYVYYNIKDLTAILCVESNRHKCLVIGEDLGTVPEGFREYMAEHGLLSYKVFFRQKEKNGGFIAPEKYQYMSLAQTSTHDQATAYGFWQNNDIEIFNSCGLYVNEAQYQSNIEGRGKDCRNMLKAFERQNIAIDNIDENLHLMVNEYGAKTASALFLVRLCDVYKQVVLDNAPGTVSEYPNWRIKLTKSIEDIKLDMGLEKMLRLVKKYR